MAPRGPPSAVDLQTAKDAQVHYCPTTPTTHGNRMPLLLLCLHWCFRLFLGFRFASKCYTLTAFARTCVIMSFCFCCSVILIIVVVTVSFSSDIGCYMSTVCPVLFEYACVCTYRYINMMSSVYLSDLHEGI